MPRAARGSHGVDALFVQSAASFTSDGATITLHGVADATIYVVGRTLREVGHLPLRRFVELWEESELPPADDVPTAVVSFVGDEGGETSVPDTVVALAAPQLDGADLTYRVEVVEGSLPREGGACAVFIDRLQQPLTAVSAAFTDPRSSPDRPG